MAPAIVGRVSYTGDLGYEIWMKPEYQRYLYDLIMEAGAEFGIKLFGLRALNALRVEKSFGSWSREYRPLYGPLEAGLGQFVALKKEADFIGKEAAAKEKAEGGTLRLRTFVIDRQGCRCDRRRADLAERQGLRLGDVRRIRAYFGCVGGDWLCAQGCRR